MLLLLTNSLPSTCDQFKYYFGRCSSQQTAQIPLLYSRGRSTWYFSRLYNFLSQFLDVIRMFAWIVWFPVHLDCEFFFCRMFSFTILSKWLYVWQLLETCYLWACSNRLSCMLFFYVVLFFMQLHAFYWLLRIIWSKSHLKKTLFKHSPSELRNWNVVWNMKAKTGYMEQMMEQSQFKISYCPTLNSSS